MLADRGFGQGLQALGVGPAEPAAGSLADGLLDRVDAGGRHVGGRPPLGENRGPGLAEVVGEEAVELGEHHVGYRLGLALAIPYNVGEGGAGPRQRPQIVRLGLRLAPPRGVPGQEPQGQRLGVHRVVLHLPHAHGLAPVRREQRVDLEDLVAVGLEERDEVAPVVAGRLEAHARPSALGADLRKLGEQGFEPLAVVAELEAD